uniref:Protein smoothened n=1 Tax=Culicoides sonorensis TaxID=179676 RepID=A0A336K3M0_CULSO
MKNFWSFVFVFNFLLLNICVVYASIVSEQNVLGSGNEILLEVIEGTRNYRVHGKKGKDEKTWFDGREMRHIYCARKARCERLRQKTCFGSPLPYNYTSISLTDSFSQEHTLETLYSYQALKHVPKCWAVIQPFLCAVFLPKCEEINGENFVYLPSLEMCRKTQDPCRILYNTTYFPEFLKCKEEHFPTKCNNDVREMKFNATGQCLSPMVAADNPSSYYKDIEGCGIQCQNPLYTDDEHRQIHKLVAWGSCVCLLFNVFTIATFLIDWANANKYPALVIFYINLCYMIVCLGWLAQFISENREDIVCRRDGTLRRSEPQGGENLSCIFVFISVYYFLIAAMVWFVIFTYAWHMSFKAIGKIQERIDRKSSYFHLIAWSLPLILTIAIMGMSEVDGDSITGVCFVGHINHPMRAVFLLGPVCAVLLVGGFLVSRGLITLIRLKISSKEIISSRASKKIRQSIVRMGLCSIFILVFKLATLICHINEFRNSPIWAENLKDYIICRIQSTYTDVQATCKMNTRPSVAVLQLHLLCLFASGIVMSSWIWTHSTFETWSRFFRRKLGRELEEPVKLQKHKVIAQAFAKRKEFQNQGRLSISFHDTHTDPVGLNFDIDSVKGSHDFSSTWANNLPRFVNRRGALTCAATSSSQNGTRRNSIESEISFSVRHVSVESRRNSIDSQVSVKIAEMKTKVASRSGRGSKSASSKNRHRRRDFTATSSRRFSRKESTTSMESQSIITAAIKKGGKSSTSGVFEHQSMKRRTGIAAMDPEQFNNLLANNKLLIPFFAGQNLTTSEDDNPSMDILLKQLRNDNITHTHNDDSSNERKAIAHDYNTTDDEKISMKQSPGASMIADGRSSKNSSIKAGRIKKSSRSNNTMRRTRKSSRNSTKSQQLQHSKHDKEKREKEKDSLLQNKENDSNDSFTTYNSDTYAVDLHSSYSGMSKANSRNSKRSCDVGIQANAHEIATQTMSSYEFSEKKLKNDENHDIYATENHSLLPKRHQETKGIAIRKREADTSMSETEKLKLLLLPSK